MYTCAPSVECCIVRSLVYLMVDNLKTRAGQIDCGWHTAPLNTILNCAPKQCPFNFFILATTPLISSSSVAVIHWSLVGILKEQKPSYQI